jgi:hypothetical protein
MQKGETTMKSSSTYLKVLTMVMTCLLLAACQSTYYKTMEAFGYHKREILVDRVEEARDAQQQAKEQFQTALEKFTEVTGFEGGDLEKKYDKLKSELDKSESRAKAVSSRIKSVEDVAEALFKEWQSELDQYTNDKLRTSSQQRLDLTLQKYQQLITAMKRAESKIEPVLLAFRDNVLFLKHNLNAQAIASLQAELDAVESDIASLIRDMEVSIAEADEFINAMTNE